jgi:hypothetical protein
MMALVGGLGAPPSSDTTSHCVIHVWRGGGDAPAGQRLVITEDVARRFGLFAALLDDYDDDLVTLPCPASEADVNLMVAMLAHSAATLAADCPICYEALGGNHHRTGCCNQPIHSACLSRALASTPTCPLCRQAGALRRAAEPRGGPPLPTDAGHFLRFYGSAHHLTCSAVVDVCAKHLAAVFRGKTVEQIVGAFGQCDEKDTLYDDLVRLALNAMPYSAAHTLCQKFRASRRTCRAMDWRTAARLLELDLPSRQGELAFQLASPLGADAVAAARALVDEHGAAAADAVHRALEEFAPGGLVRDVGDLPACIELRALADEHMGPWVVFQYATMAAMRPIILHVQDRMLARNQPLGVRNVVHIRAGPGCCKTTTAVQLARQLGEGTVQYYAKTKTLVNDFNSALVQAATDQQKRKRPDECGKTCASFLYKVHAARRRRPNVCPNPSEPGAVQPFAGFGSAEVARVMNELNTDPVRVYAAGSRKEAIVDALMRDGAPQMCFGSITRWVWLDNEQRKRRGRSLGHDMAGVKVRCAHIANSRGGGGGAGCGGDNVSPVTGSADPIPRWWCSMRHREQTCRCSSLPRFCCRAACSLC